MEIISKPSPVVAKQRIYSSYVLFRKWTLHKAWGWNHFWSWRLRIEMCIKKQQHLWPCHSFNHDIVSRFPGSFRFGFQPNASKRIPTALSLWVICRKGRSGLISYLTCLPYLDSLIYPSDSRSKIMFLADLSVIPIKLDNSRPVIKWWPVRKISTIARWVRNVQPAILYYHPFSG